MKRKTFALLLALALALALAAPAAAYNAAALVPQQRTYTTPFADTKGSWCDPYVKTVYEAGLMDGKSTTTFDPTGTLSYAQIMAITARLHELLNGGDGKFDAPKSGEEWFQPYFDYLENLYLNDAEGIYDHLFSAMSFADVRANTPCERTKFVWMLSAVSPALPAINAITVLPDVYGDEDILSFYNAGIVTGSNEYGTFNGMSSLNRGQAAAMLARLVDPSQRVKFTPKSFSLSQTALGLAPETTVLTIDGYAVSADLYLSTLSSAMWDLEAEAYSSIYDLYEAYFDAYMADEHYDDFEIYMKEKYGIDLWAETAIQWNVADKEGIIPAERAAATALDALKQQAALMNHAGEYPLTAAQKAEVQGALPGERSYYYGYGDALVETTLTAQALMDNLAVKYAPAKVQFSDALADSGQFYGQVLEIYYSDSQESSWYLTRAEAQTSIQEARQAMAGHSGDSEYFTYLCQKYDSWNGDEMGFVWVDHLSDSNQTALRKLATGGLSNVIETVSDDPELPSAFAIYLKGDPMQDESIASDLGYLPAMAQLELWAKDAKVTTTAAYEKFDVETIYNAIGSVGKTLGMN